MLKIKTTVTKMKNVFDSIIRRLNKAKKVIGELADRLIETSQTGMQRGEIILQIK